MDGLGGGSSSTSKIAIVGPSNRPDCDVDYLFGQVSVKDSMVDYSGNCGNLTAGVAIFSIFESLFKFDK